jgi:hypothetical protein
MTTTQLDSHKQSSSMAKSCMKVMNFLLLELDLEEALRIQTNCTL